MKKLMMGVSFLAMIIAGCAGSLSDDPEKIDTALVGFQVLNKVYYNIIRKFVDILGVVTEDFGKKRKTFRCPVSLNILALTFRLFFLSLLE